MKFINFCTAKESINEMKRPPTDWKKMFTNDATDKGLISKYTNNTYNSISKKQTTQSKNGQKIFFFWGDFILFYLFIFFSNIFIEV